MHTYTHTYRYVYIYMYKHTYVYIHIYASLYFYMYISIYLYTYVCMCTEYIQYVCIYVYVYIHVYMYSGLYTNDQLEHEQHCRNTDSIPHCRYGVRGCRRGWRPSRSSPAGLPKGPKITPRQASRKLVSRFCITLLTSLARIYPLYICTHIHIHLSMYTYIHIHLSIYMYTYIIHIYACL